MSPLALSLVWSALAGQILDVRSETQCPAAERIEERVRQILDLKGKRIEERAIVTREAQSLRVVLRAADGHDVGERVLSAEADCDDLAQAVAVVLATWISDVHPEFVGALPQPEPAPTTGEATPPPPAPPAAQSGASTTSEPRATFVREIVPLDKTSPTGLRRRFEPGLGIGVGVGGPKAAAAASLLVAWIPASSGVGLTASATLESAREQPLGDGTLAWRRWPVAAGLALRMPLRGAVMDVSAGGALAWAHLAGRGFPSTSSADDFTLGAFASMRMARSEGWLVPFAALTAYGWLARSVAYVRPDGGGDLDLPRYDVTLVAGVTWRP